MLKKGFIIVLILLLITLAAGLWGTSKLITQRDELSNQVENLEFAKQNLQKDVSNLRSELNDLKNTPIWLLEQVKTAFQEENYELAKEKASIIVQSYPGSLQSVDAQKYIDESDHQLEMITVQMRMAELSLQAEQQEQQRLDALANKEKLRSIIRIKSISTSKPDFEGSVDFSFIWQNRSDKVVKYLYVSATPYNGVGDPVACMKTKVSMINGIITGPIKAGAWFGDGYRWNRMWYNNTIKTAVINSIDIRYMDGSAVSLNEEEIKQVSY